ncbi:hypothetical protein DPSP01_005210 [Paraphaeosphaeria sporulosa]|uniref:MARVEL domain-containing protein n=1 Tax=Paraphaeosphaeria sporulosa TaxID=1460663 RepID=A0A177BZL3_9PLEO|nr:uncharacterized protein CC84DRAFT_1169288 [Paraphaeosphaeria sporulosa]OAF99789.1 hypothetical protein CC84DRAFT_1169288 [Paraphaeosphaeria sporulosa]
MASSAYYEAHPLSVDQQQQQHLLSPPLGSPEHIHSGRSSEQSSPLKPLHVATSMDSIAKRQSLVDFEGLRKAHEEDTALKARIRRLRVVSRVLGLLISVAVFIPIALTLHKFLSTQNVYRDVTRDGVTKHRTAWAKDSKVWPTWMYFLIAAISVVLNIVIIFAYKFGIDKANKAATVATTFNWFVMLGNLAVWCVAASLYRTEKDKDGKSNDLWGWTCSPLAREIQKEFAHEVDFDKFCNVQSISWYIGLVQVGAAVLTVVTYVFVMARRSKKKSLKKRHSQMAGQYPTNY